MSALEPPVTYNQVHTPRNHTPGRRRISIYWAWSYPWEAGRDPADIENRFSTMTEVRQVAWPAYEKGGNGPAHFIQGIAGTLELFTAPPCRSRSSPVRQRGTRWRSSSG